MKIRSIQDASIVKWQGQFARFCHRKTTPGGRPWVILPDRSAIELPTDVRELEVIYPPALLAQCFIDGTLSNDYPALWCDNGDGDNGRTTGTNKELERALNAWFNYLPRPEKLVRSAAWDGGPAGSCARCGHAIAAHQPECLVFIDDGVACECTDITATDNPGDICDEGHCGV